MKLSSCLLALAGFLSTVNVFAQDAEFSVRHQEAVDAAVKSQMIEQSLVGVAVGVIQDGKLVYSKGYGFEDRENEIACTTETMFRWASVSKPVTAIAAMQLVEAGKLNLDDDVRKYVPEFPDKEHKITVRDLMCHQSGIVHYSNGRVVRTRRDYKDDNPFESVILALDRFRESPLVHPPGEQYSYSTHAYILLSAVVERAGEQKFAEQVQERICAPLELSSLQPDYQWVEIPNRAVGYWIGKINAKQPKVSTDTDVSWKLGGGGFISTIDDMGKFAECLINKDLLGEEAYQTMWTPQQLTSGENAGTQTNVGLGFFVEGEGKNLKISHNGAQEKTRTRLVVYPNRRHGIVVMTNSENGEPGRISTAIYSAMSK